ncbi:MAG TPA: hypothetical protein VK463_00095 [Desulfomonilaceae bacterium]|nr:hypothetical protein [Desulfomonilaceae bacterium]
MSKGMINDLIEAAQSALHTEEIEIESIYEWKKQAIEYLTEHLGSDHYYTHYFINCIQENEHKSLLTGGGVLAAVREAVARKDRDFCRRFLVPDEDRGESDRCGPYVNL